jgi:ATP-dependent 26S proteasome regulatory subunit
MKIEPGVDFSKLAAQTEGFSGADLQALVYNAHLESVHDVLAMPPSVDTKVDGVSAEFVVLRKESDQPQSKAQQAATSARVCPCIVSLTC